MSEKEKKAIEEIKKDEEYYDILHYIEENKYDMWNVEKLMRDSTNGNYTQYEIAESIVYFVNRIEKQQKEIELYEEFLLNMKEKMNNFQFEAETGWRKIEKLEKKIIEE